MTVEIGVPQSAEEDFWYTPYRITGAEVEEQFEVFGVDSLASLLDAIVTARFRLQLLRQPGVEVSWLGGSDLGFPEPTVVLPPGDE